MKWAKKEWLCLIGFIGLDLTILTWQPLFLIFAIGIILAFLKIDK